MINEISVNIPQGKCTCPPPCAHCVAVYEFNTDALDQAAEVMARFEAYHADEKLRAFIRPKPWYVPTWLYHKIIGVSVGIERKSL